MIILREGINFVPPNYSVTHESLNRYSMMLQHDAAEAQINKQELQMDKKIAQKWIQWRINAAQMSE